VHFDFKKFKKWGGILLLALVCIGGTELAVCRMADPALFQSVTAPVRQGVEAGVRLAGDGLRWAVQGAQGLWEQGRQALSALLEPEPEPESEDPPDEVQLAGRVEVESTLPLVDPAISSFAVREDLEYLTGGGMEIIYYNQTDEQWAQRPYGRDKLGGYGCGPTAMSMVVSSLTGTAVDPEEMAQVSVEAGCWASGHGSSLAIVERICQQYGLECISLDPDQVEGEDLLSYLAGGELLVALMTKGHFTDGGHFIVLRGATLSGEVLVADPASRERSLMAWEPSLLLEELSRNRSCGGPLWRVRELPELTR